MFVLILGLITTMQFNNRVEISSLVFNANVCHSVDMNAVYAYHSVFRALTNKQALAQSLFLRKTRC